MPNVSYAVQKAIRARLIDVAAVTALVPATSILDRNERPAPDPSIILGEDQVVDPGTAIDRSLSRVHSTLHVWKKEGGLSGVKAIAAAVRDAIRQGRLSLDAGLQCADCRVSDMRFLRDPDGVTAHGVITVETLVREVA
ncbi:hypothetical protein BN961_02908 [Afipia felis]|uniref:DUF3168 domain-containing protein n=1 Tax=Afipia felis TaxID=1035 RepID=A0A090MTG2_AFIFE|nr:DUF3168 domain-containing protein [Afipia felis]CEG09482.1 hypothetical protein BN961_02908 [Afipia felis]